MSISLLFRAATDCSASRCREDFCRCLCAELSTCGRILYHSLWSSLSSITFQLVQQMFSIPNIRMFQPNYYGSASARKRSRRRPRPHRQFLVTSRLLPALLSLLLSPPCAPARLQVPGGSHGVSGSPIRAQTPWQLTLQICLATLSRPRRTMRQYAVCRSLRIFVHHDKVNKRLSRVANEFGEYISTGLSLSLPSRRQSCPEHPPSISSSSSITLLASSFTQRKITQ